MIYDELVEVISDACITGITLSMPGFSSALATKILASPTALGQHPTLLEHYIKRPTWQVAGVDYPVGVPIGTLLTDWQLLSGPGISVNSIATPPYVSVYGVNNPMISSIDFSLHGGASLRFQNCSSPSVVNCYFGGTNLIQTSNSVIWTDPDSPGLTVSHSTIDGAGGPNGNLSTLISARGVGTITLINNWLKNSPQHAFEIVQAVGDSMTLIYKYNLVEQLGMDPGAHPNYLQFSLGAATLVDVQYNTTYQQAQVAGGEGFQFDGFPSASIRNVTCAYNTMITAGATIAMSYLIRGFSQNPGAVHDNYFDLSAAYGWNYPGSLAGWVVSNNFDMVTGNVLTPL
jgi:hypothetical protein